MTHRDACMAGRKGALLVHLWVTQQRRMFSWKNVLVGLYFYALLACAGVGLCLHLRDGAGRLPVGLGTDSLAALVMPTVLLIDFLAKLLFRQEAVVMDDSLKTRPITEHIWNRFLVLTSMASFWTWASVLVVTPLFLLFVPFPRSLLCVAGAYTASLVNSLIVTCWRKSVSWPLRLLWLLAFAVFWAVALVCSVAAAFRGGWLPVALCTALCVAVVCGLTACLDRLRRYDDHRQRVPRARSLGRMSPLRLECISIWRARRLRQMVLFCSLLMLAEAWLQAFCVPGTSVSGGVWLCLCVATPSVVLGQWVFGVEANYFQGLWTKPVSVRQMLLTKFRFYALLNLAASMLVLPAVFRGRCTPALWVATLTYCSGCVNLLCMPTSLYSTRLDLFSSAFLNYQGARLRPSLCGLLPLVPVLSYGVLARTCSASTCSAVLFALGAAGWALHPWILGWLAAAWTCRRHRRLETYDE